MQDLISHQRTARASQDVVWIDRRRPRTVVLVDDNRRRVFKRAFASQLLALRAESAVGSQSDLAAAVPTSAATYARWEDMEDERMPDVYELSRLVAILTPDDPDPLLSPKELTPREREMARRLARARRRGLDQALGGA